MSPSYSNAYYRLGCASYELGDMDGAMQAIERGLAIEPNHPQLLCEMGFLLQKKKQHKEALNYYRKAQQVCPWAPTYYIARAMRGEGTARIDLGQLDEAELILRKSLDLEPDSKVAKNELLYIEQLRSISKGKE